MINNAPLQRIVLTGLASLAATICLAAAPAWADDDGATEETSQETWEETTWEETFEDEEIWATDLAWDEGDEDYPTAAPANVFVNWQFVTAFGCVLNMSAQKSYQGASIIHSATSLSPSSGACSPDKSRPRVLVRIECFNQAGVNINNSPTIATIGQAASVTTTGTTGGYCDSVHRISYNGADAPTNWGGVYFRLRINANNTSSVLRCEDSIVVKPCKVVK